MKNNNHHVLELAWHYTIGKYFSAIAKSGVLVPATAHVAPGEKPILWFSCNQYWEPTASKAIKEQGIIRTLSMWETWERGGGLARFGIARSKLIPWQKLKKKARIPKHETVGLELVGLQRGAQPRDWYGITKPLPLSEIQRIEVLDEDGNWVDVTPRDVTQAIPPSCASQHESSSGGKCLADCVKLAIDKRP